MYSPNDYICYDGYGNQLGLSSDYTIEIMPIIAYIGVVFPFVVYLLLSTFWFLNEFEGNANVSVAIKSGSTVYDLSLCLCV